MAEFSNRTLQNNWYEDRLLSPQEHDDFSKDRKLRPVDHDILYKTATAGERPLIRIPRTHAHVSSVVCDDGFRQFETTQRSSFIDPHTLKAPYSSEPISMLTEANISEVMDESKRPVKFGVTGNFKAVLNVHPPSEHDRHLQTTNWDAFGNPPTIAEQTRQKEEFKHAASHAGVSQYHIEARDRRPEQVTLIGERLKEHGWDAAYDTRVQRSWMPTRDKGVEALSALAQGNKENHGLIYTGGLANDEASRRLGATLNLRHTTHEDNENTLRLPDGIVPTAVPHPTLSASMMASSAHVLLNRQTGAPACDTARDVGLKNSLQKAAKQAITPVPYVYASIVDPKVMRATGQQRSLFTLEETTGLRPARPAQDNHNSLTLNTESQDRRGTIRADGTANSFQRTDTFITKESLPGLSGGEALWSDMPVRAHNANRNNRVRDTLVLLPSDHVSHAAKLRAQHQQQ